MLQGAALRILGCFYDSDRRGFSELCEGAGYPTDLGGYYIRQLVASGHIEKLERGQYGILPKGKQELAFRHGKSLFTPKPRLHVLLVARQKDTFIVLRRTVQPFMGSAEWLAGQVHWGESTQEAATRVLVRQVGHKGKLQFKGFFRRTDLYETSVFDDKLFAVYTALLADDAVLQPANKLGEIVPCTQAELAKINKPAKSLLDIFHYSQSSDSAPFKEQTYPITKTDLSL